jgi:hypothetical protein
MRKTFALKAGSLSKGRVTSATVTFSLFRLSNTSLKALGMEGNVRTLSSNLSIGLVMRGLPLSEI